MRRLSLGSARSLQSLGALLLMVLALSLATPKFLTVVNQLNILRQISVNLCLSIGMTLVILGGGIDLSVGAVLALAGAVAARLAKAGLDLPGGWHADVTLSGALAIALLVGGDPGWFIALVITP